ncbi:MAG: diacylglycerol kinase [Candidatus Omnitrophica bacterium CG07_land_8_20_14_0_80_42_15]|uniref:Diacylglycerol kinase n=1 Tax=Candidatus Aquitaenariimonas noxiae TaxID=1974741 RepID=A0A2J0L114_9BACT|nr:MAG: diacylglycerol kinase [Candidatus Omnitrophica bacterium CG07_land_8_20_14_0_80_42_15]
MKKFVESFNNAIEGFIYVLKTERNMRIHFLVALLVVLLGTYMNFFFFEIMVLCIIVTMVLMAEMINTAIELTIDLLKDTYHPVARVAKDVSAGAVLLASVNAGVVGYVIFSRHIPFHIEDTIDRLRKSPWNVTLLILIVVMALTITGKIIFHKGTPLRGGMPSGHSAIVFAIWAIIALSSGDPLIALLTLLMAILVAKSRISMGVHTLWEVITGSILGFLTSVLIFQIFKF